jgi:hypothetical protein
MNLKPRFPLLSLVLLLVCYAGFGWYLSSFTIPYPSWMVSYCYQSVGIPIPTSIVAGSNWQEASRKLTPRTTPELESKPAINSESAAQTKPLTDPHLAIEPHSTAEPHSPSVSKQPTAAPEAAAAPPSAATAPSAPEPDSSTAEQHTVQADAVSGPLPKELFGISKDSICTLTFQHNVPIGLITVGWIFISAIAFISPLTSFNRIISRWFHSDTVALMTIFTVAGMAAVIFYWLHVFLQILTILAAEALARIDIQAARMSGTQAYWILTSISLAGLIAGWLGNGVL